MTIRSRRRTGLVWRWYSPACGTLGIKSTARLRSGEAVLNARLSSGVVVTYPVSPYIEERDGGLYVAGSGVSLDSVAIRFQQGASPEKIIHSFPALKLSQVYG